MIEKTFRPARHQLLKEFSRNNWRLWFLALLSQGIYIVLARWFPLRPYHNINPLPDIRSYAPSLEGAMKYASLLLILYIFYWLAYKKVIRNMAGYSVVHILGVSAFFSATLLFAFPINSTDIYRYYLRGRISHVYDENPFEVAVDELPNEPLAPLAGEWAGETSPYGPVWEMLASKIVSIAPDDIWINLLLFKGVAIVSFLLIGLLLWFAFQETPAEKRTGLTLLWAWNPSLLLIFAMDGHNDAVMTACLVLGWLLLKRGNNLFGIIAIFLAPLIKPVALLIAPYFFIYGWQRTPGRTKKYRYLIVSSFSALLLLWLTFYPFGSPIDLIRRLVSEAGSGGGFSPLAFLILELRQLELIHPVFLYTRVGTIIFLLFSLGLLWKTWRGRSTLKAAADAFAAYIVQAFRFRIWYAAWPFPWLLLDYGTATASGNSHTEATARLVAGISFLLASQLSVLIYGQLRIEVLGASQLRAHRYGVLFTFALPLVVALIYAFYTARLHARHREK